MTELILASASPRRKELLQQIGVSFSTRPVDLNEYAMPGEKPDDYVTRLAEEKARAGFAKFGCEGIAVLGSDTTVVLDGRILGKPVDETDAIETLMALSGRKHQVMTAISLVTAERTSTRLVTTDVYFHSLNEHTCRRYWQTGEPSDKAGSYGIQGLGAVFVDRISGSYSSVVGLPLSETAELLKTAGVSIWGSENN